jgi:SHS2 domain-containing protein
MKRYEVIEHTADIGLRIYGKDLKELFINAAMGLFSLITDLSKVRLTKSISVNITEENKEELLVSWLNELLFQFSAHNFLAKQFKINKISDNSVLADIRGQTIDLTKHKTLTEIKAATYHDLEIIETGKSFEAKVIFDT